MGSIKQRAFSHNRFCQMESWKSGELEEEEEDRFFDSREDITSISDSGSEKFDLYSNTSPLIENWVSDAGNSRYQIWIENPNTSVNERRHKFHTWMGLRGFDELNCIDSDRFTGGDSGAVLRSTGFESSRSSWSFWSNEAREEENFVCRVRNLDDGTEYVVDESSQDYGGVSIVHDSGAVERRPVERRKRVKKSWLRRLCHLVGVFARRKRGVKVKLPDSDAKVKRVRVRPVKKRSKEMSALYMGQEIHAHNGSILTMKFSPDGLYLASAGEDGIVRVWELVESERSIESEIPDIEPSCVYFKVNHFSELAPLFAAKEKTSGMFKSMRVSSHSACVVFPPKVIRISDKPLHEFHGHNSEVLDLSWSNNKRLLSSSVDNTVRLWQVGQDQCLKIFSHNNYVTSVHFNPVDDDYFISGSIDGKVRIWTISGSQVVDWTDIKEIVTAVSYRPDGQVGIVGTMTGNCHFYNISDNHLQLDNNICLMGKKKFPGNRITGFQFSPSDARNLMVTSADSQIRILDGLKVISKYKGLRNSGTQLSASFTLDGKHIISSSEDSNVYVWNHSCHDRTSIMPAKSIWSCERFFSNNVSVALPWCGWKPKNSSVATTTPLARGPEDPPERYLEENRSKDSRMIEKSPNTLQLSSPNGFPLGRGRYPDTPLPKGSATWPEEKLPTSSSMIVASVLCKSRCRFLKNSCKGTLTAPHAWSLMIVTAGWDGRIRSFQNYGLPVHA